ncbi:MAG: ABC transporter ATP-binding protein, partial [Cytophagaceae bacterium]|nr:ABC transporter ATP-binding protein [Cytophagaceae bacterium]
MSEEAKTSGNLFDLKMIGRLMVFVKPYKLSFYALVFLTIATAILGPAKPYLIGKIINSYISRGDKEGLM